MTKLKHLLTYPKFWQILESLADEASTNDFLLQANIHITELGYRYLSTDKRTDEKGQQIKSTSANA